MSGDNIVDKEWIEQGDYLVQHPSEHVKRTILKELDVLYWGWTSAMVKEDILELLSKWLEGKKKE